MQDHRGRRIVHDRAPVTAALQTPHTVSAGDEREAFDEFHRRHRDCVDRDRHSGLEANIKMGRLGRLHDRLQTALLRSAIHISKADRPTPETLLDPATLVGRSARRNASLTRVGRQLRRIHLPHACRCEDGDVGIEHVKSRVQRLIGRRVRHHRGTFDAGDLEQLTRDQGARELADERTLIERATRKRGQQELAHELVARVDRMRSLGATRQGTSAKRRKVFALTDVQRHRDHVGVAGLGQPVNRVRRSESTGIRKHDRVHA